MATVKSISVMKAEDLNSVILTVDFGIANFNIDFSLEEVMEKGILKCIKDAGKKISKEIDDKPESMDSFFLGKELDALRVAYARIKSRMNEEMNK